MSDDEELGHLDLTITETRRDYFRARDHLRLLVEQSGGSKDALEKLLVASDEFGVEHTIDRLTSSPERMGFAADTPLAKGRDRDRLVEILSAAHEANLLLGSCIAGRENILCARDPDRQRVYNLDGREVVLDVAAERVRFVDEPQTAEVLEIFAVEPRSEPTREFMRTLEMDRERRRRRERER